MSTVVCSVLDRVGFLWGHKIPLPIKGALFRALAHGVGGADKQKGGRLAYSSGPAGRRATFLLAGSSSGLQRPLHLGRMGHGANDNPEPLALPLMAVIGNRSSPLPVYTLYFPQCE